MIAKHFLLTFLEMRVWRLNTNGKSIDFLRTYRHGLAILIIQKNVQKMIFFSIFVESKYNRDFHQNKTFSFLFSLIKAMSNEKDPLKISFNTFLLLGRKN